MPKVLIDKLENEKFEPIIQFKKDVEEIRKQLDEKYPLIDAVSHWHGVDEKQASELVYYINAKA